MKIKYKVTGAFGCRSEGDIVKSFLLVKDDDSGIGLCYHFPNKKEGECGSFEFVKEDKNGIWISAFGKDCYVNLGKINKKFRKFLESLK